MSKNDAQNLLVLFQHPAEPTFLPKDKGTTVLDVPTEYISDRYKPIISTLQNRFENDVENHIPIEEVSLPDFSFASPIRLTEPFSLFNPSHRKIAGQLISVFMDQPDVNSLMSVATYARDHVNKYLFQYALAVAVQHRPDTKNIDVPSQIQIFPEKYIAGRVFAALREEVTVVAEPIRMTIDIPKNYTATNLEPEQNMAYFREDIGVNLHHWHWHLIYPAVGPDSVVKKNRRGELFYYMHSQIQARYAVERICNRMPRVRPLSNFREAIPEAYFPKLLRSANNRVYPPRSQNMRIVDTNRVDNSLNYKISDMEKWRTAINTAIDEGFVVDKAGNRIKLDEFNGIDILGDLLEASSISINSDLYGDLHNAGHVVICYAHDPEDKYLEDFAVMGDVATAMRDPVFYRWHAFVDDIFRRFKSKLPQYTSRQLKNDGISITSLAVQQTRGSTTPNRLNTYWQRTAFDLQAGLDFSPDGNVFVRYTHLQYAPFTYNINVTNSSSTARKGTCRIFIAPRADTNSTALSFQNQRPLMIELDKFVVTLNPGQNTIVRRSTESSVTIPKERTFTSVGAASTPTEQPELDKTRYCRCGWPQHMLLPKGRSCGLRFNVFAMISDNADDAVVDPNTNIDCSDSHSYCGLRDRLYPDKRSMGFPFDRVSSAPTLRQFISPYPNMSMAEIQITYTNVIRSS